jgi:hypothetical protein
VLLEGKNAEGKVHIPESVTEISTDAFKNNTRITKIIFPDSLKKIHSYAFDGCSQLSEVKLGSNLTEIQEQAFSNCNIEYVNIPNSIKIIYSNAFDLDVKFGWNWYYFYSSDGKMAENTWIDGYHVNANGVWDR